MDAMQYRRPPATVSFEDLRRRCLPQVLFVHPFLPEGVTVCDINEFAAMIEDAYHTPNTLHMRMDRDENGNERCAGIGNNGRWEWLVTRPTRLRGGERYASCLQGIWQILIAPESDGQRLCTVELTAHNSDRLVVSRKPITFRIRA